MFFLINGWLKKSCVSSDTCRRSLELKLSGNGVLMSTTKPPNMSSKLLLEVGEPTPLYVGFDRSTIDQKKTFLY